MVANQLSNGSSEAPHTEKRITLTEYVDHPDKPSSSFRQIMCDRWPPSLDRRAVSSGCDLRQPVYVVVNCVHCLMLSMYCFRGLPGLRFPSTYPSTTVVSHLAAMPSAKDVQSRLYESLHLRTYPSNSRSMPSSYRILLSVIFPSSLYASFCAQATFPLR